MPAGNSYDTSPNGESRKPSAGIERYILRKLLRDVNDSEGVPFDAFFSGHGTARRITSTPLRFRQSAPAKVCIPLSGLASSIRKIYAISIAKRKDVGTQPPGLIPFGARLPTPLKKNTH